VADTLRFTYLALGDSMYRVTWRVIRPGPSGWTAKMWWRSVRP